MVGSDKIGKCQSDRECTLCANPIKEERQFAHQLINDKRYLIDVEEYHLIDEHDADLDEIETVEVDEETPKIMVYGVLKPQAFSEVTDWNIEMDRYKEFAFSCIYQGKEYVSGFTDFKLLPKEQVIDNCIPCVLLLQTSLPLTTKKSYGFGYSMFLRYSNHDLFSNIFLRDFVLCVRDIETSYTGNEGEWTDYINLEVLGKTATSII